MQKSFYLPDNLAELEDECDNSAGQSIKETKGMIWPFIDGSCVLVIHSICTDCQLNNQMYQGWNKKLYAIKDQIILWVKEGNKIWLTTYKHYTENIALRTNHPT